jgi:hypothetical protein
MQRFNHDGQQAVNPQPQPGFYAIIPAQVRYCRELPPAAKLLFGELVALTSIKGYCFAQNPYFMELYGVDRATVKRWLVALQKMGFIAVEYDAATGERRIYCNAMFPGGGGAKTSQGWGKNAPHSITDINTKRSSTSLNVSGAAAPLPVEAKKGAASRRSSISAFKSQKIDEVVSLTDDAASSRRFRQLYEIADKAGLLDEWDKAYKATETALKRATKPVAAPGAYFGSILAHALTENGVAVPVGTVAERSEVRSLIAQSLAAEDLTSNF